MAQSDDSPLDENQETERIQPIHCDSKNLPTCPISCQRSASQDEVDPEQRLPLGKAIKLYPKVARWCLVMTLAIISWGYQLVIVGAIVSVDAFKRDYGETFERRQIIPSMWLSMWFGLPPAGTACGAMAAGWLGDRFGRKWTLFTGSVVSAGAVVIIFFSHVGGGAVTKRAMFTGGITIQGFAVGLIKTTCLTYVSENAPTSIRGSAMALFPTFTLVGQLIGFVVTYVTNGVPGRRGYLGALGSQGVLALAPFIISLTMHESPAWLLRKGKTDRALRSATKLFAPKINPSLVLKGYRDTLEEERATKGGSTFIACFKDTNIRRTFITILANVFPALFGLDLLSNANTFLETVGLDSSTALLMMIAGVVAGIGGNAVGIWTLSRVGRRQSTFWTMGVAAAFWCGVGVCGFFRGKLTIAPYFVAGFMVATIVVCGMGCWPAGYAILGETPSLRLRAKTQGIGNVSAQASSIIMAASLPYLYQVDAADLGAFTGFVYCGLCITGVAVGFFCLPEMKGRSGIEIDRMFELRLPTRKFREWRGAPGRPDGCEDGILR
ncbi:uncharacterized protein J7T54_004715 [Emericellopsis cladophorae]|uniref:Major facilitator superfamily (MFS) profile domain-containing protein n=1 Tax=Emericellopsis cladophorae TaxID=2686198 RepID=A0A9P9Y790_9HYPO|nr:uncharacterized protein J7T54_004715 [Emericellopsis cladophorae]KAI6784169.1 hypothetical protein J7T54_004715 [Emericellopsis cladophorae]